MTEFGHPEQLFTPAIGPLAWETAAPMRVVSIDAPTIPASERMRAIREWRGWADLATPAGEVVFQTAPYGSTTELPPRPDTSPRAVITRLVVDRRTTASALVAERRREFWEPPQDDAAFRSVLTHMGAEALYDGPPALALEQDGDNLIAISREIFYGVRPFRVADRLGTLAFSSWDMNRLGPNRITWIPADLQTGVTYHVDEPRDATRWVRVSTAFSLRPHAIRLIPGQTRRRPAGPGKGASGPES